MNRRLIPLCLALTVPGLAACGGSAPSKADYLAEIDAICKRGNEISSVFTTPTDLPMLKEFGQKMADNVDKTVKELDNEKTPKGDDGKAAKDMLASLRAAATASRSIGAEVDASNFTNVEANAGKAAEAFKAADAKARAFGSTECGKGEAEAAGRMSSSLGATVKKAYIAKVEPLCAAANKEVEKLPEPEEFSDVKGFVDKAVAIAEKLSADVKAIPPPTTDKAKLDEWITAGDATIAKAKEAAAAAASNNERKTLQLLDEVGEQGDASNAKADAYGFKECGTEGAS